MERIRNEAGIAMVTVLFVGMGLTAVATTASVITIQELQASTDDRKAAEALSYAEAGVDRLILELRHGTYNWGQIRTSGCPGEFLVQESGTIGGDPKRTYDVKLEVYDDRPGIAHANRLPPTSCTLERLADTSPRKPKAFAITAKGEHPTARRVVRQIVLIESLELPIGIYADRVDSNGSGGSLNISLVTPTDLIGREKLGFRGLDPYYTKHDFYNNGDTSPMPAAAHAAGSIYYVVGGGSRTEHPPSPNCDANRTTGTNPGDPGQSLWDGSNWTQGPDNNGNGIPDPAEVTSGCSGQTGFPPRSNFTLADLERVTPTPTLSEQDYLALKEAAKSSGLYCSPTGGGFNCLREGQAFTIPGTEIQPHHLGNLLNKTNFITYFDYPPGDPFATANEVGWKASVEPCDDDPSLMRSSVVIVRNGSIKMKSGSVITGAVLVPEGRFDSAGSYKIHGTIIAKEFIVRGGADLQNSSCWVNNIPGPFLDVTPTKWSEVDR